MNKTIYKVAFRPGLIAFISTVAYFIVQLLQVLGILRFPFDGILIFGYSLLIAIPFMLEMLALHAITPIEKNIWSHSLLFIRAPWAITAPLPRLLPAILFKKKSDAT